MAVTIAFIFVVTYVVAKVLDMSIGLRVTPMEEEVGLDISSHGERAYISRKFEFRVLNLEI